MTEDEVICLAKIVASEEGWVWQEPIKVFERRSWIFFGSIYWEVISNAEYHGGNIRITIEDRSGKIISKGYCPR